jgi:hypothetical protein
MESHEEQKRHEIEYFVNGEKQETKEHKLKASEILGRAGFTPASDYELERDRGHKKFEGSEEVEIHEKERFTAVHTGPVPTS